MYYLTQTCRLAAEIGNKSFYFSPPHLFNDRDDCDFNTVAKYLAGLSRDSLDTLRRGTVDAVAMQQRDRRAMQIHRAIEAGWTPDHLGPVAYGGNTGILPDSLSQVAERTSADDFVERFVEWIDPTVSSIGVKCFTQHWDNSILWERYGADGHGVGVGVYEHDHLIKKWRLNVGFYAVQYVEKKEIPAVTSLREIIRYFMTVKSKEWACEDERRILSFRGNGMLRFRCSAVREVILGPQWFSVPSTVDLATCASERTALLRSIMDLRRAQGRKRLRVYVAEAGGTDGLLRHEIHDDEMMLLWNCADRCHSNREALDYISRKRAARERRG